ncbi:hypothetical protein GQ53DRAFT_73537 [Thozetella sp. PMI_491]|nr:hypothetical protein GQ53DRAFT_73537 [Thozetella sp. PMI_491]
MDVLSHGLGVSCVSALQKGEGLRALHDTQNRESDSRMERWTEVGSATRGMVDTPSLSEMPWVRNCHAAAPACLSEFALHARDGPGASGAHGSRIRTAHGVGPSWKVDVPDREPFTPGPCMPSPLVWQVRYHRRYKGYCGHETTRDKTETAQPPRSSLNPETRIASLDSIPIPVASASS